jgi:hypothetical protein
LKSNFFVLIPILFGSPDSFFSCDGFIELESARGTYCPEELETTGAIAKRCEGGSLLIVSVKRSYQDQNEWLAA